jgi:hypothetical protein
MHVSATIRAKTFDEHSRIKTATAYQERHVPARTAWLYFSWEGTSKTFLRPDYK